MNKESPEYKRIREEIACNICDLKVGCEIFGNPDEGRYCKWVLGQADQILSIKGIAIEADLQDLPPIIAERYLGFKRVECVDIAQVDMLKAKYRRVI